MNTHYLKFASLLSSAALAGVCAANSYEYTTDANAFSFSDVQSAIRTEYSEPDFTFDDTVNLTINSNSQQEQLSLSGASGISLNSLTVNATSRIRMAASDNTTVRIGELIWTQATQQWGSRILGGNWEFGNVNIIQDGTDTNAGFCFGEATTGALQSLKISGNLTGKISQFRVGKNPTAAYDASRWNSADIDIGGYMSSLVSATFYTYETFENGHMYYKFGAINQSHNLGAQNRCPDESVFTTMNFMITGNRNTVSGGVATMSGDFTTSVYGNGVNAITIALFMNSSDGQLTQRFSGNNLQITGGITVTSGTLLINFRETSGRNHGNLTMEGGRFGSTAAAGGNFLFTDLVYSGGAIALAVDAANETVDSLTLSGTAMLAEGSDAKIYFDFSGDIDWLIDSELNDGKGVKIVSWDSKTLESDQFAANIYESAGDTYVAQFTSESDGLYVKYVVPEPAEVALAIGALALASALCRRRNRK